MIKKLLLVFLAVTMLMSVVSCASSSKDSTGVGYTFTDSEGATVTLKKNPQKIAVLFSSYADIWVCAGGNVDITVYETVERGFAGTDAVLVDGGSGHSTIDMETLIAAEPDLVIGTSDYDCQRQAVESCRSAGIPSALLRVESFDDYLNVLRIFCDITGKEENYNQYGIQIKNRIDNLMNSIDGLTDTPKILFVRAGSSAKSTKAKTTQDHFACAMLKELGVINIADSESSLTGTLSLEVIIESNPDYLFITTMGDEQAAMDYMNSLLSSEGWKELDCVKNNRYCFLPKDLFHFKPNSKWAEAYEYLISILYPETNYAQNQ